MTTRLLRALPLGPRSTLAALLLLPPVALASGCDKAPEEAAQEEADDAGKEEAAEEEVEEEEEEDELPPSHEGEDCESHGVVQACSVDEVLGWERCMASTFDGSMRWSRCFVDPCEERDALRDCTTDGGSEGLQACITIDFDQDLNVWGKCEVPECEPGETKSCFGGGEDDDFDIDMGCRLDPDGVMRWSWEDCNTPLVLSFDGQAPTFGASSPAAAAFDVGGAGLCDTPDWPSAATPWLALDRDRSGTIDGGHELFGSGTRLAAGGQARGGFEALAELDADGDGQITAADPVWSELVVWSDADGDRRSTPWELLPVTAYGLVAIDLGVRRDAASCDPGGSCAGEQASFSFRQGASTSQGTIIDVYLACD